MTHLPTSLRSARAAVAAAVPLAMLAGLLAAAPSAVAVAPDSSVFINELHYDNAGTDAGEFVEVAGPAGTRPDRLEGRALQRRQRSAVHPGGHADRRARRRHRHRLRLPGRSPISGPPERRPRRRRAGGRRRGRRAVPLLRGRRSPPRRCRRGQTSTDIGVARGRHRPVGLSLQLTGTGDSYGDFTWAARRADSPAPPTTARSSSPRATRCRPCSTATAPCGHDHRRAATSPVSATDADSAITASPITSAAVAGITLDGFDRPAAAARPPPRPSPSPARPRPAPTRWRSPPPPTTAPTARAPSRSPSPRRWRRASSPPSRAAAPPRRSSARRSRSRRSSPRSSPAPTSLDGFFVQEEDADADADPATSEGSTSSAAPPAPTGLAAGDLVRVVGTVAEFFDNTQIDATAGGPVEVLASGLPRPTAATVTLPAAGSTEAPATFETVEGMVTTIPTTLAVSEYFALAQFGEIVLTAGEREYQYTQTDEPERRGLRRLPRRPGDAPDRPRRRQQRPERRHQRPAEQRAVLLPDARAQHRRTTSAAATRSPGSRASWSTPSAPGSCARSPTRTTRFDLGQPAPGRPRRGRRPAHGRQLQRAQLLRHRGHHVVEQLRPVRPDGTDDCRGADSEAGAPAPARQDRRRAGDHRRRRLRAHRDPERRGPGHRSRSSTPSTPPRRRARTTTSRPASSAPTPSSRRSSTRPATVTPVGAFDLLTSADDPRFVDTAQPAGPDPDLRRDRHRRARSPSR